MQFTRCFALLCLSCLLFAADPNFSDLRVAKQNGSLTGPALVTVNGKTKRLAANALAVWPVMNGQNALVLVLQKNKNAPDSYRLRFYDGVSRKYRDLGVVPFTAASLAETKLSDGMQAFILSGAVAGRPIIAVAGPNGVHGLLEDASTPRIAGDNLTFTRAGSSGTLPFAVLLATNMTGIYAIRQPGSPAERHVQFLRDGVVIFEDTNGAFKKGKWRTDGEQMLTTGPNRAQESIPLTSLSPVQGVPAGTRLTVRLLSPLSSEKARKGDPVEGVLISPANIKDQILLPQGTHFLGTITQARGVGWAVKHETAALTLVFTTARLPDGTALKIHTQLFQVENSRETVNPEGRIQGIRSTATPGHSAESKIASVAALDPVSYLFATTAATAALGFAEPEILYPAGTEILVEFTEPLLTSKVYPRSVPEFSGSSQQQHALAQMERNLPFRTATKGTNKPSDLTNLAFIGPTDGLCRAFQAAGWIAVDRLTAGSSFLTLKAVGGNQVYNQAPMSTLLLDERPPIFTLTKTTNTFSSRHHLRVFDPRCSS